MTQQPAIPAERDQTPRFGDLVGFVRARLGHDIACRLQEAFGGRAVYVPLRPEQHHVLAKVIGLEGAKTIALQFGCGSIAVPLGDRRRSALIEDACLSKRTASDIAKSFRCSTRWVFMKRAKLRREGRLA